MQKTNFKIVDRSETYTTKYDDAVLKFGTNDLLPLWVADMDLASPVCIQEALQRRAKHPVYGYTVYPQRYFDAIKFWMSKRFSWNIKQKWIVPCYGVVPSMNFAIEALTQKGDGVIVQTPIYPPFVSSVKHKKRNFLENKLLYKDGKYFIDFKDFEKKAKDAKLFLLCSPHNPTGRVWDKKELRKLIDICLKHDVFIVSDEIHADIVYEKRHCSVATFKDIKEKCIVLNAPSKTFNIAGLNTSYAIIPSVKLRRKYKLQQDKSGITNGTPFGIEALISAYEDGGFWLDELKLYLAQNRAFVIDFVKKNKLPMDVILSEATFLLWIDCRKMGFSHENLVKFFIKDAKLGLNDGKSFGVNGDRFMRLNIGTSKEILEEAMQRILMAYKGKYV